MLKKWFDDSETIFWARLQFLIGAIATAMTFVDASLVQPILPANWGVYYMLINGIATEYLRRRRGMH